MEPDPLSIVVLIGLLLVAVYVSSVETAMAYVKRADVRALGATGDVRARRLENLWSGTDQVLAAFALLRTLVYVISGATLVLAWRPWPNEWLLVGALAGLWLVLALIHASVRAFVILAPLSVALRLSSLIGMTVALMRPFTGFVLSVARIFGNVDESIVDDNISLTEEGLRLLMRLREDEDQLEDAEREMMASILELEETIAREAMVPRIDMVALSVDTDFDTALAVINEAGHSRIPVYENNIDRILGFLYAKDMLKSFQDGTPGQPIRSLLRPAYFVPATKKLNALFSEMQKQHIHIALVVDEYGGTAGLITIEDILEEIVGEIQDEYDTEADDYVQPVGTQGYLLNARLDVDTLGELLRIEMPDENADTLGGMLYSLLGRVPQQGDAVTYAGWRFHVILLDGRRIEQVRVEPIAPIADDEEAALSENSSGQRSLPRFLSL